MLKNILAGSCALAVFGIALSPVAAHAGFQWVAQPDAASAYAAPAPVSPAPMSQTATMQPEIISPVVISGAPVSAPEKSEPAQILSRAPLAPASSMGTSPTTYDLSKATISMQPPMPAAEAPVNPPVSSTPPAAPAGEELVQGFGSQIPLALALRQVLPVGYSFSIDPSIDMNTLVSYKGGRPWRETTRDMLAGASLTFRDQGTSVVVSRLPAAAAAPAPEMLSVSSARPTLSKQLPTLSPPSSVNDLPVVNVGNGGGWSALRGDTLHKVLTDWSRRAGVELQWHAEYDYPMEASAHFSGDFEDAVRSLLSGFENARPQPIGELHASAGQKLLVIQIRGNNYSK